MSIAYQPATTTNAPSARPLRPGSPHALVLIEEAPRALTLAKIAGLLAITTFGTALATAFVTGTALFALSNIG